MVNKASLQSVIGKKTKSCAATAIAVAWRCTGMPDRRQRKTARPGWPRGVTFSGDFVQCAAITLAPPA
jgi:hypothetical protein